MPKHPLTLLDGGMGSELREQGAEVPSHITSIWSARALFDAPQTVEKIHRDYIDAGADVITVNNYAVTEPLLAREGLEDKLDELTIRAAELAERARDSAGKSGVRIAGSMPPLETSYRSDLVGPDEVILAGYRRIAAALGSRVDILLCETLSSAREAVAAVTAAAETDREVWVSFTLQGNRPNHLPSGESVAEAYAAVAGLGARAHLVNCCAANFVAGAIPVLARLCDGPVGGYANSADVQPSEAGAPRLEPERVERVERPRLDVEGSARSVAGWLDAGASIVGGCCSTRPAHIARLRELLDERR